MRALLALILMALPVQAETITVFAAASLKGPLDEIAAAYQATHPDQTVTVAYGGSSAMARQIMAGAPADVFVSASAEWIDQVAPATSPVTIAGNRLVLIAHGAATPVTAPPDIAARLGDGKLAMALVEAVPAGVYGQQALRALGQWDAVAPKVAQADDVRAALALVATGAAPYGIVYASDAQAEPRVTAIYTFPEDSHDPITYPAAALSPAGAPFVAALQAAGEIFAKAGFTAP